MKKFYEKVQIAESQGHFVLHLDGRPAKTPGRTLLSANTKNLAEAMANEWRAQGEEIDVGTMPFTRLQTTIIDLAPMQSDAWRERILSFLGADLLCYRAEGPVELVRRQAIAWDPFLDWFADMTGEKLAVTSGVTHVAQTDAVVKQSQILLGEFADGATLSARIVSELTGSAVLGFASVKGEFTSDEVFEASRVDEEFQIEKWGRDQEAEERTAAIRREFKFAYDFAKLSVNG